MPKYKVPDNAGKVRVAVRRGGSIRGLERQAGQRTNSASSSARESRRRRLAKIINGKKHGGEVEVWS